MKRSAVPLEDLVLALYCALDDALRSARVNCTNGKLIPRRGPPPAVDDREVLCLAVLQELMGFESDNHFHDWLQTQPKLRQLFPRQLSRQNFADRRLLLAPLMEKLCGVFCALTGDGAPPFLSSTAILSMSAAPCELM